MAGLKQDVLLWFARFPGRETNFRANDAGGTESLISVCEAVAAQSNTMGIAAVLVWLDSKYFFPLIT